MELQVKEIIMKITTMKLMMLMVKTLAIMIMMMMRMERMITTTIQAVNSILVGVDVRVDPGLAHGLDDGVVRGVVI